MSRRTVATALAATSTLIGVLLLTTATALAATPEATRAVGNDPRSSGEGPGIVGQPLVAIGVVVILGLVAVAVTTLYVRTTDRRRRPS